MSINLVINTEILINGGSREIIPGKHVYTHHNLLLRNKVKNKNLVIRIFRIYSL